MSRSWSLQASAAVNGRDGYYFNVGCSDLVADGEIDLIQFSDIDRFVADGARLKRGETLPADLVVPATGYKGQDALVRRLFGDAT